ncbi:MAG: SRPBCC domain-containing protein [Pedobacter sp.]|nr:MAG: SRPBCC domain-containing protein [Pedobacter sp.]
MKNEPISLTTNFAVSKTELFKAWTEQPALTSWWKPVGRTLSSLENEIKDGGKIRYKFDDQSQEGELIIEGEYQSAIPEEKLVYSWNWIMDDQPIENGIYLLTVEFKDVEGGSQLSITQQNQSEQEGIHPHEKGWEGALKSLKDYLER